MKLFTKYNRVNLLSTIIIFLLGSIAFGFLLHYIIIQQIDEDLKIEENEIITYITKYNHLPSVVQSRDQYTTFDVIEKPDHPDKKIYTNKIYNAAKHEKELVRTIAFDINVNDSWFLVNVSKSLEGTDDLIQTIIIITLSLILLIVAVTFFINRVVLRRLWQPFYNTLQAMQQFTLTSNQNIHFTDTSIDEFNYLNSTLSNALNKAQHDYATLKSFTENASHELQTPLAVIQSKLDILSQNEKLSENEAAAITSAYSAVQGLSKLNQSLLLLAKIENRQFSEQSDINIKAMLENKLNEFCEIWRNRNTTIQTDISTKIISGNIHLIEILLNNLLSNATKHNVNNGSINILLNENLQISNTGINSALDEKQLYKRFSKQSNAAESYGLGLSIVQQICITSGYDCMYSFTNPNIHTFTISW